MKVKMAMALHFVCQQLVPRRLINMPNCGAEGHAWEKDTNSTGPRNRLHGTMVGRATDATCYGCRSLDACQVL